MKTCPSKEMITALASGRISTRERRTLLIHIAECPDCAAKARRFDTLAEVLQHAHLQPDGSLKLEFPRPRAEFSETLQQSIANQFEGKKQWMSKVRSLLRDMLFDATPTAGLTMAEPTALGARRATGATGELSVSSAETALLEELGEMIATLLDRDVPPEIRSEWAAKLQEYLHRWRSAFEGGVVPDSSRNSPIGKRKRAKRRKHKS